MEGDIGLVLCSCDTQIRFSLEKRNKKVSNCGSQASQIYHMWLKTPEIQTKWPLFILVIPARFEFLIVYIFLTRP